MTGRAPSDAEILEARARRLAQPVAGDGASAGNGAEMLGFKLGRERYAIGSRFVVAVLRLVDLVPLPGAQAPVIGLTRWRGDVLTVLDLRRVAGGAPRALDDLGRVIVVGETTAEFGVLADELTGLLSIDPGIVHPLPVSRRIEIPGLLDGVTADGIHVISAPALIAHQTTTTTPSTVVTPSSSPGSQ